MGASGRIRPDVFLIMCVWERWSEAGLGAQCFIEILIVLRFRSEGKSWSNALPIGQQGMWFKIGCSKYRQRVGVELHGSVGFGGAVCKTTNKKHPNCDRSDVWVLCKGIEPLFRDWESLVLAVRRTEQDYFRGAKIGKKFFVPNFDSVFLWVNVNRGEIKGVLLRIGGVRELVGWENGLMKRVHWV